MAAAMVPTRWERPFLILFDVISAFPSLVLALAVVAVFGPSNEHLVGIVALTLVPHFGRVARAQSLALSAAPFLEAERILGASAVRIVVRHMLPNIAGPLVVLASMEVPVVITIEAGLSFIGLGVRPPLASWGTLIYDGYAYLSDSTIPVTVRLPGAGGGDAGVHAVRGGVAGRDRPRGRGAGDAVAGGAGAAHDGGRRRGGAARILRGVDLVIGRGAHPGRGGRERVGQEQPGTGDPAVAAGERDGAVGGVAIRWVGSAAGLGARRCGGCGARGWRWCSRIRRRR